MAAVQKSIAPGWSEDLVAVKATPAKEPDEAASSSAAASAIVALAGPAVVPPAAVAGRNALWTQFNASHRKSGLVFFDAQPSNRLLIEGLCMEPPVKFLNAVEHIAGMSWEKRTLKHMLEIGTVA